MARQVSDDIFLAARSRLSHRGDRECAYVLQTLRYFLEAKPRGRDPRLSLIPVHPS